MKDLFVTGTGTEVGKTVLAALLTSVLGTKYWKPIQTGVMNGTLESDSIAVKRMAELDPEQVIPEAYVFDPPVSPHLAAERSKVQIDFTEIQKPKTEGRLVIEGAGGILVPINDHDLMIDLARHLDCELIIATQTSLGTINHTLLTVNAIREYGLPLMGVVMIGKQNLDNRSAIERYGKVPVLGWIPWLETINRNRLLQVFENQFERSFFS